MQIHFSAQAQDDLAELLRYIAKDNPDAAYRVQDAILDTCDRMLEHPTHFPVQPSKVIGLQKAVVRGFPNYVIFFCTVSDGVRVIRLGDGHQDWKRYL